MDEEFLKTGIEGLDRLLGSKGFPKGSAVVLIGGPGSGKTLLSLQICKNLVKQGKKCLFWSLNETEEKIKSYLKNFGWDVGENLVIKKGDTYAVSKEIENIFLNKRGIVPYTSGTAKGFFDMLKSVSPDFFVLDSLTAISSIFIGEKQMYRVYLEELFKVLVENKITSILICEEVKETEAYQARVEEFLADGVITLYNIRKGSARARGIEILKFRGLKHERKIVSMEITDEGIIIYPEQELLEL